MDGENLEQVNKSLEADANALLDKVTKEEPEKAEDETPEPDKTVSDEQEKPFKSFLTEDEWKSEVKKEATSLAQSEADKRTQRYADQVKNLRTQTLDLQKQLNEKDIKNILEADFEDLGEDKAKKRNDGLKRLNSQLMEFKEKQSTIQTQTEENEKIRQSLIYAEKRQKARDLVIQHLLPDGEKTISKFNDFITELMEAESYKEMALIAKTRGDELKAKVKPQAKPLTGKVASGKTSKLTFQQIKNMSPDEKIKRNKEIQEFFELNA